MWRKIGGTSIEQKKVQYRTYFLSQDLFEINFFYKSWSISCRLHMPVKNAIFPSSKGFVLDRPFESARQAKR